MIGIQSSRSRWSDKNWSTWEKENDSLIGIEKEGHWLIDNPTKSNNNTR